MASNEPPLKPTHLEPSPLGTKEYWDSLYETEITNYSADASDVGTIWFNDSSAEDKVLQFLEEKIVNEGILGNGDGASEGKDWKAAMSFLDLGTGNGHFLLRLRGVVGDSDDEEDDDEGEEEGWGGRMLGVDYSKKGIEFARRIAASSTKSKNRSKEGKGLPREVEFLHWGLLMRFL
ncbi:hypothetical protein G7Y89_g15261 [Cudoniella acicularis]|uniref:Methyltransferase domain-containing protein n=1 Tax=Cudoniella acicularis TaxID=354080 RepID=A0A8H4QQV6_9HELO|nr:hypothetical protein G7Y89_g15261 [Cudoniella acicularis]